VGGVGKGRCIVRTAVVAGFVVVRLGLPASAVAQSPPSSAASVPVGSDLARPEQTAATGAVPLVANAPRGIAVVALTGAADAAWPLAQGVYADPALRGPLLDEASARTLCGDVVPGAAQHVESRIGELAETVAAVRGEDAPSRALLSDIARRFAVRALVVVHNAEGRPLARVFLAESATFDAATYAPDAPVGSRAFTWSETTRSLARAFGGGAAAAGTPNPASRAAPLNSLALHDAPEPGQSPKTRQFFESGWFWAGLGAAALAGGAIYLATRDSGSQAIHLQVQVPHE